MVAENEQEPVAESVEATSAVAAQPEGAPPESKEETSESVAVENASDADSKPAEAPGQAVPAETPAEDPPPSTEDAVEAILAKKAQAAKTNKPVSADTSQESRGAESEAASPMPRRAPILGGGGIYMGIALLAALGMGAAMSYRQELAQKQLIEQFANSVGRLENGLARFQINRESPVPKASETPRSLDDYTHLLNTANARFQKGRFQEAAVSYGEALTMYPAGGLSDQAHYRLGMCMCRFGKPDSALEHFRAVVTSFPGSRYYARAALEMSYLLMSQKNYSQARRILYLIIGSRNRLEAEDSKSLEKAYYAIARCFEGEAEVIDQINELGTSGLDTGARTGDD